MTQVKIRIRDDGPLLVDGVVEVVDAEGNRLTSPSTKPLLALCRCGDSKTKPFCDGTHRETGFQSVVRASAP
jgi:CDGSH iron-sulfur domain-containing protein 3